MIRYDRNAWWRLCFGFRGTALPHVLPRVGLLTGWCLLLFLLDDLVLRAQGRRLPRLDPTGHTVLGVALSLLIVFRCNASNARFWEARSHWGMIINTSRNLVRLGAAFAPPADDLARLVAAYVLLVKEQLRDGRSLDEVHPLLPGRVLARLAGANNPAQVLAASLSEWVARRLAEGRVDPIQAGRMEALVGTLVDSQGGCEKIHRTPMPYVYAVLIKQVLLLYLATLPFVLVPVMHVTAPLVIAGVSLAMLGIEEAGIEIEDPFALEHNHLPLDDICAAIGRDAADLTAPPQA